MTTIMLILISLGIALVTALIIPDSREWLLEYLEEAWDITSDLFSNAFSLDGFSAYGLIFGTICAAFIYFTRNMMLNSFLQFMSPVEKIIWGGLTYIGCFAAGYFLGNAFEQS